MGNVIELPEWWDVNRKVEELGESQLSAMEFFVYQYEPCGAETDVLFRRHLQDLIDEIRDDKYNSNQLKEK
jgi:hypothetical protein